jgi:peptidoglycan biosynthesis protein MviN/MurJ (putative lipid II flippase)
MNEQQVKHSAFLFIGQLLIKGSNFFKQLLMAFFLGVSEHVDVLLVAQIVPSIVSSMFAGGAGEILVANKQTLTDKRFSVIALALILLITLLVFFAYYSTIPLFTSFFFSAQALDQEKISLFVLISSWILLSRIPAAIVSVLQHQIFAEKNYKFYVLNNLISELSGVVIIWFFVGEYGIVSFAWGALATACINALSFIYKLKLPVYLVFSRDSWRNYQEEINVFSKRVVNLSGQTMILHLTTFWERALGSRYMQPGFVAALNYSKSLSELPRMAMLSSILTTTYIEQTNRKKQSEEEYENYTYNMEFILSKVAFFFQIASIIFGPALILLLYNNGKFDSAAVELTFSIYQVLSISFVPNLMLHFLSRTMYIESEYRNMLKFSVYNFIAETLLMWTFIQFTSLGIPIAITISKFIFSFGLFRYLTIKNPALLNYKSFIRLYILLLVLSIVLYVINIYVMDSIIEYDKWNLLCIYFPIGLILALLLLYLGLKYQIRPFNGIRRISIINRIFKL